MNVNRLSEESERDGIDKLVVGAVVHCEGRVLILRRSTEDEFLPGIEELPSGGVEDGEGLLGALARELAEEIGWSGPVPVEDGFAARFDYVTGAGRKARQFTFSLPSNGQATVLSDEHTAHRWLEPADVEKSDLTRESIQVIREWAGNALTAG